MKKKCFIDLSKYSYFLLPVLIFTEILPKMSYFLESSRRIEIEIAINIIKQ